MRYLKFRNIKKNKNKKNKIKKDKINKDNKSRNNKETNNVERNNNMRFTIFAIISIILFAVCISPIELQNDTFYTIKIGELITQNGIDMVDHFSWHNNLPYTYPHWAYDVFIYLIYNSFGFTGIYVSTAVLACILGLLMFFVNKNLNKNNVISFVITIGSLFLLKDYIAARAQLITFILFLLEVFCIEKFIQGKNKKIYGGILVLISLIIANVHVAVWPFLFILYLPVFAEQVIVKLYSMKIWNKIKSKIYNKKVKSYKLEDNKEKFIKYENDKYETDKLESNKLESKKTYKFIFNNNKNVKYLLIVVIVSLLMGFITPLKDVPFTYLYKTMIGNTTQSINEHLPLTLIENKTIMVVMFSIISLLMITKIKISFKNFCMLFGLMILCFISRRQISLFVLIGNIYVVKMLYDYLQNRNIINIKNIEKYGTTILSIFILLILVIFISWLNIKDRLNQKYINEIDYPIQASIFIKERLVKELGDNLRLFNEYNYGSYLIFNNIPVFIDSRADLYAPEFNGTKNNNGDYEGRDIFSDFMNASSMDTYYEVIFDKYDINYVLLYRATKLNIILCRDDNYTIEYIDDDYVVYKRNSDFENQ